LFLCSFIFREGRGKIEKAGERAQFRAVKKKYPKNPPVYLKTWNKWNIRNISTKSTTYRATFPATLGTNDFSLSLSLSLLYFKEKYI
jgi:hypothetical protein